MAALVDGRIVEYSPDVLKNKPTIEDFADAIGIFVNRLNEAHGIKKDSKTMATLAGYYELFLIESGAFTNNPEE